MSSASLSSLLFVAALVISPPLIDALLLLVEMRVDGDGEEERGLGNRCCCDR